MNKLSLEGEQAFDALREAVAEALERKRRLGQYAIVWRDGRPARIEAEDYGYAEQATLRQGGE